MARPADTESGTIGLRISDSPRRFSRRGSPAVTRPETELISDDRSYVLLGDPGSGKTTTLRRLARQLIESEESDGARFPIVLRLRELPRFSSLFVTLANTLAFPLTERVYSDTLPSGTNKKRVEQRLGDLSLNQAMAAFFNSVGAILLLDGLDELLPTVRRSIEQEIAWLLINSAHAKTIVSCRSGDYTVMLEGMDVVELCPLAAAEIKALARCWLPDADRFFEKLETLPYRAVAERPLLLAQLMLLYQHYGNLPEQPVLIYERIVRLMLQEWDASRAIRRQSRFSGFMPERKLSFLAAMAYHLTAVRKSISFTEGDLLGVYTQLHERFALPPDEARAVVAEIEAHTGLIAVAGNDRFEFSHISLQEYLCAHYIVREPFALDTADLLDLAPNVMAIAVALSADPSTWFASLFLSKNSRASSIQALRVFIARLVYERPNFRTSASLGAAFLKLFALDDDELTALLMQFLDDRNVAESVRLGLDLYEVSSDQCRRIGFTALRCVQSLDRVELTLPSSIIIRDDVLDRIKRIENDA